MIWPFSVLSAGGLGGSSLAILPMVRALLGVALGLTRRLSCCASSLVVNRDVLMEAGLHPEEFVPARGNGGSHRPFFIADGS